CGNGKSSCSNLAFFSLALSALDSSSCNNAEKRCENVAGVADSIKELGGCSVTPTSAAEFDWSVGIFATTATQSRLAANAAAKQGNCQKLHDPCTPNFFFSPSCGWLGVLFCGVTCLC